MHIQDMIFDTHIHTNFSSCSSLDVHDLIRIACDAGLDGICITDHQTMEARHEISEGVQPCGLVVIFGMEYETPNGDFLIFGPYEDLSPGMDARQMLTHVGKTGGTAIAAHPFRTRRSVSEYIIRNGLCHTIEIVNGRNTDIENLKVQKWQSEYRLTGTGGSDAHTESEVGKIVTRFFDPIHTRKDLIHAINCGRCRPECLDQIAATN